MKMFDDAAKRATAALRQRDGGRWARASISHIYAVLQNIVMRGRVLRARKQGFGAAPASLPPRRFEACAPQF